RTEGGARGGGADRAATATDRAHARVAASERQASFVAEHGEGTGTSDRGLRDLTAAFDASGSPRAQAVSEVREEPHAAGTATRLDSTETFVPITSADADHVVHQSRGRDISVLPEPTESSADRPGGTRGSEGRERPADARPEEERGRSEAATLHAHPNFHGEVISRDVAAAEHQYHRGE